MGALVFLLHKLARQTGIDDLPWKNFIVTAAAAGVKGGIDLRFAQRRIQIALQARRGLDDARDASIAGREQRLFVSDPRRHCAHLDVGNT